MSGAVISSRGDLPDAAVIIHTAVLTKIDSGIWGGERIT